MTARILQIIVGLAGLCALVLGLFIWIANGEFTDIHMLFGLLVTLGLLVMSIIALTAPGLRIWGLVVIIYAIIVLIFGVSHSNLLVGNLRLYDPDPAHAGRHRCYRADRRTWRTLPDAEARRGEARIFISSAAALSFSL
jgi:hypothetical protein